MMLLMNLIELQNETRTKKKYKVVDDDLINGYQVLTGKQLNFFRNSLQAA